MRRVHNPRMRHLTLGCLAICAGIAAVEAAPGPEVTFTRDVAPILYAKCVTCHRAGEVAPMPLLTFEEARPWARAIKLKVESRQMPPWYANPAVGTFANDPRLNAAEIATITKWVDAGAPRGDLADMPKPPQFTDGWQLGEPDLVVELPEVQIPATGNDFFPTPTLALPLTEDHWIRAVEVRPSNRAVTHHSVIFATGEGSAASGSGLFDVLAVWSVGTPPTVYPEGTGRWLRKGQSLRTNLHYHPNGTPQVDRTKMGLYFGKGELKKEIAATLVGDMTFAIPPNTSNYELRATYIADQDIEIASFFPHMHLRGNDMTITATYPGGARETLLNVPAYDFNWQLFYYPKESVSVPKGTRIDLVAHYDNSAANKRNPDPNKTVTFGEASTAEMMFGMFEFTARQGVSPVRTTARARAESLAASFGDAGYVVDLVLPNQTLPSVLHIPRSGEGAWYLPTNRGVDISPIKDLQWTGNAYRFSASLRVGTSRAPFTVKGEVQRDGTIRGSVEPIDTERIPFKEYSGSRP